jgi:hypothetical protein
MKTSLALCIAGFVFMGMTLRGEDRLSLNAEPMLMAYYTPERSVTLRAEPASVRARVAKIESKLPPTNWSAALSHTFKLSSAADQARLNDQTIETEQSAAARPLIPRTTQTSQAKFSINNLMEGSIYDFRKANGMRLEVAPPESVKSEAFAQNKYEEPFCLTFWLRFSM